MSEHYTAHVWAYAAAQHSLHVGDYALWLASGRRSLLSTSLDDQPTIARDRYNRDDMNTRTNWDLP